MQEVIRWCVDARIRVPAPSTFYVVILRILPSSLTPKLQHHCVHIPAMQQGREKGEQTLPQEYDPEGTHRNSTPTTVPESLTI